MTDQSPQINLECQLCQKKFREQIHLTRVSLISHQKP